MTGHGWFGKGHGKSPTRISKFNKMLQILHKLVKIGI